MNSGENGRVFIDFETKSYADLGQVGAWVYSEHPSTEVICLAYRIRHPDEDAETAQPVQDWVPGRTPNGPHGMPSDLYMAIMQGYHVEAHNYSFELGIWANVMVARHGWIDIPAHLWRDTMAVACYYALPAKLDRLCRALGMPGKAPEGARLIAKYSKLNLKSATPIIPPEDLTKFIAYCRQDVLVEEAVSDYLGDLPERELPVFRLDQKINMRGLALDIAGIEAASAIVAQRAEELTARFRALTGLNPTQGAKLKEWFAEQGLALDNMQAGYLEDLLDEGDIPSGPAREALTIRLRINKASTKKLDAMARQRGANGRARWQTRYHGAAPGRWTGTGLQPLNLARGFEKMDPEQLVRDIMLRDPEWLDMLYGDAMAAIGKAARYWIVAERGSTIYAGDFVSIEAVILACLAGEDWKVEAFRAGKKIYELMGDKIHNLPHGTVTKETHPAERQDGKTGELAFGYQGALGAWLKFDDSGRHSDERIIEICKAWRAEHPMIVAFWAGLEKAAIQAVAEPGLRTQYRDIGFEIVDEWLSMILPNEKRTWYREPYLKSGMPQWHQPETKAACQDGTCRCQPRAFLSYMAQKEGQWRRVSTYGGKLAENATQATAREFLIPAMDAAEAAGYPVVLSVYDEVVCEVPVGFGSKEEFMRILKDAPGREWAAGWPIGVDAWVGGRYRK